MSVPLQICNGTDISGIILEHIPCLMGADFCVWCGICAKYLAFGTYPTSTVGALIYIYIYIHTYNGIWLSWCCFNLEHIYIQLIFI